MVGYSKITNHDSRFKEFITLKILLYLFTALIVAVLMGLVVSSVHIPLGELFDLDNRAIMQLRCSRIVLAILTGAGLGCCGVVLQAILKNPLAEPYLLGTSSGAGLGAVLAISLGISSMYLPIMAFIGAMITIFIVYQIALENGRIPVQSLILSGVIVSISLSGIIVFLVSISSKDAIHNIMWWLLGNLQVYDFGVLTIVATIVVTGILTIFYFAQDLNAISLGEEEAIHLGIDSENVKKILFVIISLVTGALVSLTGIIGFVGLIIPHILRYIVGPNHKALLPATCLGSATFLVFCDMISRSLFSPVEIPIGVITALIGAPLFIFLMKRSHSR